MFRVIDADSPISKEDFLKELEIIVNAYEDIYNDNEVQKMFENFKENF